MRPLLLGHFVSLTGGSYLGIALGDNDMLHFSSVSVAKGGLWVSLQFLHGGKVVGHQHLEGALGGEDGRLVALGVLPFRVDKELYQYIGRCGYWG